MTETPNPAPSSARRRLGRTLKGFLLWSHERASWQYDVMCGVIFLLVVLTPARFFHDKPVYNPSLLRNAARLAADAEGVRYRVSAELLASYDDDPRRAAQAVFTDDLGHPVTLTRIEPIRGQDGAIVWYDVWVRE